MLFCHCHIWIFATPWITALQYSLSFILSQSLLKLMSTESVMSSNHLILCHSLLLPTSVFPSIRDFSNESVLHIRWPVYWSFSFSISPSNEYSRLISFRGMLKVKVKVKLLSHVWFFATPCIVAYQAPPSMGFSRQECWSGLLFPSPGDLPDPGIEPSFSALQADALPSEPQGRHVRGT